MGSTAGGVLQTGQRIGSAIGQAVIGAVFFNSMSGTGHAAYSDALRNAVVAALCFVALAVAIGVQDLMPARRRTPAVEVSVSAVSDADPHAAATQAAERIADLTGVERHRAVVVLGSGWGPAADAFGAAGRAGRDDRDPRLPRAHRRGTSRHDRVVRRRTACRRWC